MEKMEQQYIYICFLATNTTIAKISRKISRCDFTHIAISFEESLEDFVSFSRRCVNTPLDAGIVWERRGDYIQPEESSFRTKIFRIPVRQEAVSRIQKLIWRYERDPEYMFNILSMVTMTVFHGFYIYKTENCMSFVAKILEMTGAVRLERPYYRYLPAELVQLLSGYEYFEGELPADLEDHNHKFREISFIGKSAMNIKILLILVYRMLFKPRKIS